LNAGYKIAFHIEPLQGETPKGLFDFLMSQLMNDIIRQWISKPGEFVLRYDWIDPRQPAEFWKNVIQDYFKDSFDFPIQDVVIL
jgi:hypothetical protein